MNRLSFDDYAYHAWTTAYYLDKPEAEQADIIYYGYNEEVGELLTDETHPVELTSKLWGIEVADDVSVTLNREKVPEAGDILYFIAAAGMLRGIALRDIASEAAVRYTGEYPVDEIETFSQLDGLLHGSIGDRVPDGYKPNYHTWKQWDFAPFEDGMHILLREPTYAKGPLKLIPDGRYALERLHSTLGLYISPETGNNEEFLAAAGLALGGLSVVMQHRFDSSLTAAAVNSIQKRERRQAANALERGADAERSRPQHQERIRIGREENTRRNLLEAQLPDQ
jgi:hypothetical protein